MIEWKKLTMKEIEVISKIAERAEKLLPKLNRSDLEMDIGATHITVKLNLEKLLSFDNFNFLHDIQGITN